MLQCVLSLISGHANTWHQLWESCIGCRFSQRIDYKLCLLVHKSSIGWAPAYIADMLTAAGNVPSLRCLERRLHYSAHQQSIWWLGFLNRCSSSLESAASWPEDRIVLDQCSNAAWKHFCLTVSTVTDNILSFCIVMRHQSNWGGALQMLVDIWHLISQTVIDGFDTKFCGMINLQPRTNWLDFWTDPGYMISLSISSAWRDRAFLDIKTVLLRELCMDVHEIFGRGRPSDKEHSIRSGFLLFHHWEIRCFRHLIRTEKVADECLWH